MKSKQDPSKRLMDKALPGLLRGEDLTAAEAEKLFTALFSGKLSISQAKTILLLLAVKGESENELLGAVKALKRIEKPLGRKFRGLIDTCGTGGDKSQSINISTIAAFVVAGAGIKVAKHGNRAISSHSGSSDLMEAFGINLGAPPKRMISAIREAGIGYFHAPFYHPAFAKLQGLRKSLGRRTILNLLGPLVNPMRLDYQLVGVANKKLLPLYAAVLAKVGRRSAAVCHSEDGMDEISSSHPTHIALIKNGRVRVGRITAKGLGLKRATRRDLCVKRPAQCHRIAKSILTGKETGAKRDAVLLNAAYAIWIAGKTRNLKEAVCAAKKSLESGRALAALQKLQRITRGS